MLPLILIHFVIGLTPNNVNLYHTATEPLIIINSEIALSASFAWVLLRQTVTVLPPLP